MPDGPPKRVESRTPATAPRSMDMDPDNDRYIVDASTVNMDDMGGYTIVHDLSDEIGYVVVKGDESWMPESAEYMPDAEIEIERPVEEASADSLIERDAFDADTPLQWDKLEQDIIGLPVTGEGARIGVIDSGVLGANPDRNAFHPDLQNVLEGSGDEGPSYNFTEDGFGPGPVPPGVEGGPAPDPHGTEVAGTAAAVDQPPGEESPGFGIVGLAPDAEIADLRVFSGPTAAIGDIVAAITAGATPRDETVEVTVGAAVGDTQLREVSGAGCDVVNLSLGTPPLVPIEPDAEGNLPELPGPPVAAPPAVIGGIAGTYGAAAAYARIQGTLPVASAGNSGVGLGIPLSDERQSPDVRVPDIDAAPVTFPANASGYVTVGATGPIGYGWSAEGPESLVPPVRTELPTEEPARYTNYGTNDPTVAGGTAVDVTAGGGNADSAALGALRIVAAPDLLLTTGFGIGDPDEDGDSEFVPNFPFIAGTSFAAPNVAGLAALLAGVLLGTRPPPEEAGEGDSTTEDPLKPGEVDTIRQKIQETAEQLPVGRAGETTTPTVDPAINVGLDAEFDGNAPSKPGSVPGRLDPTNYRGNGHINALAALEALPGFEGPIGPVPADD